MKTKTTAAAAYKAQTEKTAGLLKILGSVLKDHDARQEADPKNWGFAGNLDEINDRLLDAVLFLIPQNHPAAAERAYGSEDKARAMILKALR